MWCLQCRLVLFTWILLASATSAAYGQEPETNESISSGAIYLKASLFRSSSSNVAIPDNGGWVSSTITISGAPSGATVTGIDVHIGIVHPYSGDLNVDLNADSQGTLGNYDLWQREGGSADNPSRTVSGITTFNGLSVNRTWYLYARDEEGGDSGYINEWWIRVYYENASPPGSFSLSNDSPICDTNPPGPSPAVRLNWTSSSGATSYEFHRNGSVYDPNIPVNENSFYNSANVTAGQTYTYFVRARNSAGSRDSNTIAVPIPTDLCGPDIRIEPLTLSFSAPGSKVAGVTEKDRILLKSGSFIPSRSKPGAFSRSRHLILQFEGPPQEETLQSLSALGIEILHWVPRNAVAVRLPAGADLGQVPGIRWAGSLRAEDKLSTALRESLQGGLALIDFFPGIEPDHAKALVEAAGGTLQKNLYLRPDTYLVMVDLEIVTELALLDEVSWIRDAPETVTSGEPFFHCPGGITPWGPVPKFVANDDGWDGPGQGSAALTYHFVNGTADIASDLEEAEVRRALNEWSQHAAVAWTETATAGLNRSVDISWASGDHGDISPFDGTGGTLAHAAYPPPIFPETFAGDMHFDEDELWQIGTGRDVFSVALHEAGHSLGLAHSDVPAAVMDPTIGLGQIFTGLHQDDIDGILSIYAPASGTFTIFNDGADNLSVDSMTLDAPAAWISWTPQAPAIVPPGDSLGVQVTIDYGSAPPGESTRRIQVFSNDQDESPYPAGVFIIVNTPTCDPPGTPPLVAPGSGSLTNDNTPIFDWGSAGNSDEYQIQIDNVASLPSPGIEATLPTTGYTPPSSLGDGTYFWRLRGHNASGGCDVFGNWSSVWNVTIDATPPNNPTNIVSTTHTVGVPSETNVVTMTWTPGSDVASGVDGYAYAFDHNASAVCDQGKDLEESAATVSSQPLANGSWWFHICTVDNAGNWPSPVTLGPFEINVCVSTGVDDCGVCGGDNSSCGIFSDGFESGNITDWSATVP